MLAVLDAVNRPKTGAAARFLRTFRRNEGVTAGYKNVFGAKVLHISVEIEQNTKPRVSERRLNAVRRLLVGAEVLLDGVCWSDRFPYGGYFRENGHPAPDLTALYEAVASQAAEKLPGAGGTVFFAASRLNGFAVETLTALCRSHRFVLTDIAGDTHRLRELQREYGISIIENPSAERIFSAETAFFMGAHREKTELSGECTVFAVNDASLKGVSGGRRVTSVDAAPIGDRYGALPDGFPAEPLIANALKAMTLPYGALVLRAVNVEEFLLDKG